MVSQIIDEPHVLLGVIKKGDSINKTMTVRVSTRGGSDQRNVQCRSMGCSSSIDPGTV